jgi:superfamily II DNA or RNA helicase
MERLTEATIQKDYCSIRGILKNLTPSYKKGRIFEQYITDLLKANGVSAVRVGGKGDHGADILIHDPKNMEKCLFIMQAKNCKNPLNFQATKTELNRFIDEASKLHKCKNYILLSFSGFCKSAEKLKGFGMRFVSWTFVEELINNYGSPNNTNIFGLSLSDHNQLAYEKVKSLWKTTNRVAVIHATGTGKSHIILKTILDFNNKNILVVDPNTFILKKLQEDAPWITNTANLITYSRLLRITEDGMKNMKLDLIILDEFHRCGAKKWGIRVKDLLNIHSSAFVLGTTATPKRALDNNRDMSDEIFSGRIASKLSLAEAISKGILPNPKYITSLYSLDNEIEKLGQKIESVFSDKEDYDKKTELKDKIFKCRINWNNSSSIPKILGKYLDDSCTKFIIFCEDTQHLRSMSYTVLSWFEDWQDKYTISKRKKRVKTYSVATNFDNNDKEFYEFVHNNDNHTINLLFCINMLNEGVHVKGIDGVILLRRTQSPIVFYQQIGRALSIDNKSPLIFDFVNNFLNIKVASNFFKELNTEIINEENRRSQLGIAYDKPCILINNETKNVIEIFNNIEKFLTDTWSIMYEKLKKYKMNYGNCNVKISIDKKLANWVNKQRQAYKKKILSQDRLEMLNELGFIWDHSEYMYNKLLDYKDKFGNTLVPRNYSDKGLYNWVVNMRQLNKRGMLNFKRKLLLDKINFIWNVNEYVWNEKFDEFLQYKEQFNTIMIPDTPVYKKLNRWVYTQRQLANANKLAPLRKFKLNSIGFIWNTTENTWETMFKKLIEYKIKYGNCRVSKCIDRKLASWIQGQRFLYGEGKLPLDKLLRLKGLGVNFKVHDELWGKMYENLKRFHDYYGNCNVPKNFDKKLYYWVLKQRKAFNIGTLSAFREKKLKELNFTFDFELYSFEIMYQKMLKYKQIHGDCLVSKGYKDKKLVDWVYNLRKLYKIENLDNYKVVKLNSIGFIWDVREYKFNLRIQEILNFKKEKGNLNIPFRYKGLGRWLSDLKKMHAQGKLLKKEIITLINIGFELD